MNNTIETAGGASGGSMPERIEGTREDCEGLWRALRAMAYLPADMEIRRAPEHDDPSLEYEAHYVRIWGKDLALTPPAAKPAPPDTN